MLSLTSLEGFEGTLLAEDDTDAALGADEEVPAAFETLLGLGLGGLTAAGVLFVE